MGSHVMRFGSLSIGEEVAAEFMGYGNTGGRPAAAAGSLISLPIAEHLLVLVRGQLQDSQPTLDLLAATPATWRPAGARKPAVAANGAVPSWAPQGAVPQRDADLAHLWHKFSTAPEGPAKAAALSQLSAEVRVEGMQRGRVRKAEERLAALRTPQWS